jgi:hypothetical protein
MPGKINVAVPNMRPGGIDPARHHSAWSPNAARARQAGRRSGQAAGTSRRRSST